MKPERMRIKIAEACGWRNIHEGKSAETWGEFPPTRGFSEVPNYTESLDAMAEARKTLSGGAWNDYEWALRKVIARSMRESAYTVTVCQIINATPLQHAESFLRAKGLWEEGE